MDRILEIDSDDDNEQAPNMNLEEEIARIENVNLNNVKRGMFVSGWDDPDDLIEEDQHPEGRFQVLNRLSFNRCIF